MNAWRIQWPRARGTGSKNALLRCIAMRTVLLIGLVFALTVQTAEARKRHRNHYHSYDIEAPDAAVRPFDDRRRSPRSNRQSRPTIASLVPSDWQPEPPNANWNGRRFLSPDGASWFAVYSAPSGDHSVSDHMKSVAFADGETITYLRGDRTWIAVSGFKDSRIFYRKAILACAGKAWHHIAFEYPAEHKAEMDRFVASAAQALNETQIHCETAVSANRP